MHRRDCRAPTRWRAPLVAAAVLVTSAGTASVAAADSTVVVLRLEGAIGPGAVRYLARGLSEAARRDAELVVLEVDTPGGTLVSLRDMVGLLTSAKPPVAVYVVPPGARAASAGFFLLLAADHAAMAPGTNAGAAHPVMIGGRDESAAKDSPMIDKAVNDIAAFARSVAAQRGRPIELAEQAVRKSRSFSAREAADARLVDAVVASRAELIAGLDGRALTRFDGRPDRIDVTSARVDVVRPSTQERLLMAIGHPVIAYLLLIAGIVGLAVELFSPGLIVPGVVGAIALLLGLYAVSVLPVSLVGAALLVIGLGLVVAEAFVTSYGLLAAAGLASFVFGSFMLFDTGGGLHRLSPAIVLPVGLVLGAIVLVLGSRALKAHRAPSRAGGDALIGQLAEVVAPLVPNGMVAIHGEYWRARAAESLSPGARVRVVGVSGRELQVEAVDHPAKEERT
jgi:membrane-bound serine protease (ClpP class)